MTDYLFHEPRKDVVAHTALTRLLSEDDLVCGKVSHMLDMSWPAAARVRLQQYFISFAHFPYRALMQWINGPALKNSIKRYNKATPPS